MFELVRTSISRISSSGVIMNVVSDYCCCFPETLHFSV